MTISLKIKNEYYYAVINYKEGSKYKQKWITLNLKAKNNKRKAEALLYDIKEKYEAIYSSPSGDELFTAYIKKWLYDKKPLIELSTWEGYKIYAERHIIPYFEPMRLKLREVKPHHIQEYYQYKFTSGRLDNKPGGLSIPSLKKHSIVFKEVFNYAVLHEVLNKNPAEGVKLPSKSKSVVERKFLTADEANQVIKAFDGHQLKPLVCVALYYGLRRSEVLGLRWSAIDFENNTLTINHTVVKTVTVVRKDSTKTQSSMHTFLLLSDVKELLLQQYAQQEKNKVTYKEIYQASDYVFTWPDGSLYRPEYVTKTFQKVLVQHHLPVIRFHDLRHSTASILYDKGWELKDIQNWLRHSSVEVTGDIYTHISEARKEKYAKELEKTFIIGGSHYEG